MSSPSGALLHGLMMRQPLLLSSILAHAERHHGGTEIVSRRVEGDLHRYTYRDCARRARQLAKALHALGVQAGERVATLAWDGYRHLELHYAIAGSGAVIHTVNPQQHPEQVAAQLGQAQDRVLFFDLSFLPLVQALAARTHGVTTFVALCGRASLPALAAGADGRAAALLCYEDLLAAQDDRFAWPPFDEHAAASLCYASGAEPKGALVSHRATLLHTLASSLPDVLNLSASDTVLPAAPWFQAGAWGLPYAASMVGARLVFPGPALDGAALYALVAQERVTFAAGAPATWSGLLRHTAAHRLRFASLRRIVVGGPAGPDCAPGMLAALRDQHQLDVIQAWGDAILCTQGHAIFGADMQIVDQAGNALPWNGVACGSLQVKGHWVSAAYFGAGGADHAGALQDGWLPTGQHATISPEGYLRILEPAHRPPHHWAGVSTAWIGDLRRSA